jgi:MFS family permease
MRSRWIGLAALLVAEAMNLLDSTIVQVVAPTIRADLHGSLSDVKWFASAYTLSFALLLIVGGRLGDVVGRRRVFRTGVTVFLLASVACALASSPGELIAFRAVQGAAAAAVIPQTIGLIKAMFTGRELSTALGTIGPVMGLAAISGPVLGGVLTHADLFGSSWRAAFLVNVPLSLAVLAIAPALTEDRAPRKNRRPIEFSLFTQRVFPAALATSTLFFAVTTGLSLVVVLYAQLGTGASVLTSALILLPWMAGMGVASLVAGARLAARYGDRLMVAGLAVVMCGVLSAAAAYRTAALAPLLAALAVVGVGVGLFTTAFFTAALHVVQPREVGSAAGLLNTVQQLGATLGVQLLGSVYLHAAGPAAGARSAFLVAAALLAAAGITGALMMRAAPTRQPATAQAPE